ncbi:hypothetical protein [Silvanigrella aquatica]|uniref:ABC-2 type transporter domain-containing protein n=1 Tax=Silvanigrella aquatica TaxID=1915309 RepID=A0A1L4CXE9_9BACT|nr:hypothetical protein [Silvanigrella aquatica]APJ02619.1 hypothetical protein AXG55_01185 [Silvanigrella aquatica]
MNRLKIKNIYQFMNVSMKSTYIDSGMFLTDIIIGISVPVLIQICFWSHAFNSNVNQIFYNFTFDKIIFYVIITVILGRMNNPWHIIDIISGQIKSGEFDSYLVKPMTHFSYYKNFFYGQNIIYLIILCIFLIPAFFIYSHIIYFFPLVLFLYFSQYICFQMGYIFGILAFWVINSNFLAFSFFVLTFCLGGIILPLEFWPNILQPLLEYNPFRLVISGVADMAINPSFHKVIKLSIMYIFYYFLFKIIINKLLSLSKNVYNSSGG